MKRTLALVLALVMAIGLMAFPVSADFTDDADIKYTEAVDVMSAIGVIDGFEDGSFDPDGYLTREQAAKVVAYLMLGAEDADALSASSAPFDDVAANRWSAGYIAYCVNEGIINGRSDTTFDPTGNVTGYEFAKLMLGCLGYDGAIEKYTGATWNINVAKTALTVGLFSGNRGANYNVPLTREEAALYAFNMIQADLVDYDNRGSEIDLGNGVTINTGASKAQPITSANEYSTIDDELADKDKEDNNLYVIQFAERYFEDLEKSTASPDAFGRPSVNWEYDNDDVGTYSDTADITYTVKTEGRDIYDDLGEPSKGTFEIWVDGDENAKTDITTGDIDDLDVDDKIGGNGALIEVYEMDNDEYRIVIINTYVGEITDWIEADEDDDVKEAVTIGTVKADAPVPGDFADDGNFETTKFDEDDADDNTVVLYTAAKNDDGKYEIKSVDVAEIVTATPTRFTAGKSFVAGGETYKYADKYVKSSEVGKAAVDNDEDIDIYLDSYGYVIYTDATGSDDVDYALMIGIDDSGEAFSDDELIVKLLLANGEVVVADVDEKNSDEDLTSGSKTPAIVSYTVDRDDEYAIHVKSSTVEDASELKVTKGSARISIDNDDDYTANSKTVFFVAEKVSGNKDSDYDAYIGYKNVASLSNRSDDTDYIVVKDGDRIVALYVANARSASTSSDDYVAVAVDANASKQYDSDLGYYYEFDVVNGDSIETMMFSESLAKTMGHGGSNDVIAVLSSITVDDEGVVTDADIEKNGENDFYQGTGTGRVEDELITLNGKSYAYADDCAVYKMNEDAEWNTSSINSIRSNGNDRVAYILDEDGVVTNIYIREVK